MVRERIPAISVITASLNAERFITECISSVERQTVPCERIYIDGESQDGTAAIIRAVTGPEQVFVSEPDQGVYDAMNKGIRLAQGDVIGILNADDFYASQKVLEKVLQVFEDSEIDACYGDLCYVDIDNEKKIIRYWRSGEYRAQRFYWGWMPPHPTFFVRRTLYERYGGFNLALGSAADYELMLRFLLKYGARAAYIPEVLVYMRMGGVSNQSVKNRLAANRMDRLAWNVNGLRPYLWTLYLKPLRKIGQWFTRHHPLMS